MRWATKKGVSDVALQCEIFVAKNPTYVEFAQRMVYSNFTPLFEFWSKQNQIILTYPETHLTLTGIRDNLSGEYMSYDGMVTLGGMFNIPVVPRLEVANKPFHELVTEIRDQQDIEGYVLRYDNGFMTKIKTSWYASIHRGRESLSYEKHVMTWIFLNQTDDVKSFIEEKDKIKLEEFESNVWKGLFETFSEWKHLLKEYQGKYSSKKEFVLAAPKGLSNIETKMIIRFFDDKSDNPEFQKWLLKQTMFLGSHGFVASQKYVDQARHLWKGHRWNYEFFRR